MRVLDHYIHLDHVLVDLKYWLLVIRIWFILGR